MSEFHKNTQIVGLRNAAQPLQEVETAIKVTATPSPRSSPTVDCQLLGRGTVPAPSLRGG